MGKIIGRLCNFLVGLVLVLYIVMVVGGGIAKDIAYLLGIIPC